MERRLKKKSRNTNIIRQIDVKWYLDGLLIEILVLIPTVSSG
jgi:hypothetical protein